MITLDCSEYIHHLNPESDDTEVLSLYSAIDSDKRRQLEGDFLGRSFILNDGVLKDYSLPILRRYAVIYQKAVDFAVKVYREQIEPAPYQVDFEVSINETKTPTEPLAHFFVGYQVRFVR